MSRDVAFFIDRPAIQQVFQPGWYDGNTVCDHR